MSSGPATSLRVGRGASALPHALYATCSCTSHQLNLNLLLSKVPHLALKLSWFCDLIMTIYKTNIFSCRIPGSFPAVWLSWRWQNSCSTDWRCPACPWPESHRIRCEEMYSSLEARRKNIFWGVSSYLPGKLFHCLKEENKHRNFEVRNILLDICVWQ